MRKRGRFEAPPRISVGKRRQKKDPLLQMLVSSGVSLLLCFSMFLSTTMAWFSDTVISAGNQITIGKLEVDVLYDGKSLKQNSTPLFTPEDGVWAPGDYVIKELIIQNKGNLDIQYHMGFLLSAGKYEVADYFKVYVKKLDPDETLEELDFETKRNDYAFSISGQNVSLKEIIANGINVLYGTLEANAAKKAESRYAIAIEMQEEPISGGAGNADIQGETLTLNIKLVAQQKTEAAQTSVTFAGRPTQAAEETETTESTGTTEATLVTEATEAVVPTETTVTTEPPATEPVETTVTTEPPETEPPVTTTATEPPETTVSTEPSTEPSVPTETTQPPEGDGTV